MILTVVVVLALIMFFLYKHSKTPMNTDDKKTPMTTQKKNVDALAEHKNTDVISSGKDVVYFTNDIGKRFTGFLAEPSPSASGPGHYPGVVMIHEWWGLNQEIKDMATNLSKQGYRVLAVDLYGRQAVATADEARALSASISQTESAANMKAAAKYLRDTGSKKIASLGWCFGGGKSLELALSGEKLDAVIIYYGTPLVTDKNTLAKLPAPVLGIFGDKDTSIPIQQVKDFQAGLIMNDIKNEIEIYKGVGHAFANPSGMNYAPKETADAWQKTLLFLRKNLL